MKKIVIGLFALITLVNVRVQGAEILPEYFLMERLIMLMDVAPTYISNDGKQELKAIQVDSKLLKILDTNENPFYMIDSNGEKKTVRMGDYLFSPLSLSSIYMLDKTHFEENFRDEALPQKELNSVVEDNTDKIDISDIDESSSISNTSETNITQ